jgi:hypothetical protein
MGIDNLSNGRGLDGHDRCSCWHPALLPAEAGKPGPYAPDGIFGGSRPPQGFRPANGALAPLVWRPVPPSSLAAYRH